LASGTLRRDGSSRFGSRNRWGNYYAGSLGWRVDKESFLMDNKWIDKLLVRAGYGVVGNQEIPNYAFSDAIGVTYNYPFGNTKSIGYAVSGLGNSQIQWESSHQANAGVDLTVMEGKLSVSLDYFNKITSKLLGNPPIASSVGLLSQPPFSPYINNGRILNSGLEMMINYSNSIGDLKYSISPNGALLHNEVLSVNSPVPGGVYGSQYTTLSEKGYQLGSFYMLEMGGIFQSATDIFTSAKPNGVPLQPGDVKFKDQNGDGVIDGNDRKHLGSAMPKVTAGLNISLSYKNFDLSLFFQGAYGQKILSVLNRDIEGFYRPFNVTERYYQNHWTAANPNNQYPRASWNASGNNAQISSRFLEDGSYTRLKNLQIGYTIPKSALQKYGFSVVRVYFSGTNLLTFTKYSGMDPEMTASDNAKTNGVSDGARSYGIDWGTYPAARSYNFGINLTF
jgi:TonB-dependent starch-binding outer membrane protein SusC